MERKHPKFKFNEKAGRKINLEALRNIHWKIPESSWTTIEMKGIYDKKREGKDTLKAVNYFPYLIVFKRNL